MKGAQAQANAGRGKVLRQSRKLLGEKIVNSRFEKICCHDVEAKSDALTPMTIPRATR